MNLDDTDEDRENFERHIAPHLVTPNPSPTPPDLHGGDGKLPASQRDGGGEDTELLDWTEAMRVESISHSPYPDMGGNQWSVRTSMNYKCRPAFGRTLRDALRAARAANRKEGA